MSTITGLATAAKVEAKTKADKNGWISVDHLDSSLDHTLPLLGLRCLIYLPGVYGGDVGWRTTGGWVMSAGHKLHPAEVTHWQPLPGDPIDRPENQVGLRGTKE